ncbi:hypothetical protein CRM22_007462 [Opisthorchis felineus]|uniref:Uncharacterized protein n=1 Tax=Opisthorchis felineus TaxID=147828 RepID=A0A4S2LNK9_OPIFE|nr:hypothetical protein CRM22_007462 [Opisthorchis felineus]
MPKTVFHSANIHDLEGLERTNAVFADRKLYSFSYSFQTTLKRVNFPWISKKTLNHRRHTSSYTTPKPVFAKHSFELCGFEMVRGKLDICLWCVHGKQLRKRYLQLFRLLQKALLRSKVVVISPFINKGN